MLKGVHGNAYCDNIMKQILGEHTERLELTAINAQADAEDAFVKELWDKNKMDSFQVHVHRRYLRDGNYCVMPVWDNEKEQVVFHKEPWWDGVRGVFIGYDAQGNALYAVKEWQTPQGIRRTVYFNGQIERYISTGGSAWVEYLLPSDNGLWPIPYTREDGETPLSIPFVHFLNDGDEFENYGESLFPLGTEGGQDQINDLQWDVTICARMTGYQQTWSRGFELELDRSGKPKQQLKGPGVHSHSPKETAEWGVLPAGDITTLSDTYYLKVKAICRMTRTPMHSITNDWPSGEALYRAEMPIVKATQTRIRRLKSSWIEVFHRAMEIANVYGRAGLNEEVRLQAEFNEPADRDPLTIAMSDQAFWQAADFAVQAGLPLETFLRKQGWTEDDIKQYLGDVEADLKRRQADLQMQQDVQNSGTDQTEGTQNASGSSQQGTQNSQ